MFSRKVGRRPMPCPPCALSSLCAVLPVLCPPCALSSLCWNVLCSIYYCTVLCSACCALCNNGCVTVTELIKAARGAGLDLEDDDELK